MAPPPPAPTGTGTTAGLSAISSAATAIGGNGGSVTTSGNGAAGGAANATATSTNAGPDTVTASATATGGNGGSSAVSGGAGGNASATATGTGFGLTSVSALATGGIGADSALAGTATADATANGYVQTALAAAMAIGSSGSATASSSSSSPFTTVAAVHGESSTPTAGFASQAETETLIGLAAPSLTLGSALQASALGIGDPTTANVNAAWSGNTNVPAAFETARQVQGLSIMSMADTGSSGDPMFDYHSQLIYTLNGANLGPQDLLVGLLSPTISGGGLQSGDSLTFEIDLQGSAVFSETFTTNAALQAFFQDNVLNLGAENAGLNGGNLTLEFKFDFNSSATGAGFSEGLVFGVAAPAPEPSSRILLALGALGLLARAAVLRNRRRSRCHPAGDQAAH